MEFQLSAFEEYRSGRARRILKVQYFEGRNSFKRLSFLSQHIVLVLSKILNYIYISFACVNTS